MNNGNTPAMPVVDSEGLGYAGLTKREHIAALAMQGLLASDANGELRRETCVKLAVEHADALIAELEHTS